MILIQIFVKHEELKKENIPIPENIAKSPPVAEIPTTTTLPLVPPQSPKVEIAHHEIPVTPAPIKAKPASIHVPVETQKIPPHVEIPTLLPKLAEEPKILPHETLPTIAPIVDTPATITRAPAAEIPATINTPIEESTTTHTPIEVPTPVEIPTTTVQTPLELPTPQQSVEIPVTTPSSLPVELPLTPPAHIVESIPPLPVEVSPSTTTPIPEEIITPTASGVFS
uniref:Uncharacterized protein n=1 Tax=Panagrolaimus superbus TaxID=310955 RepID=A0A914YAI7_9BILA